ncbi:MAG: helix-turn-helix domain-containing protein, partial [Spirochaetes bacterium]|nr:helix-turn-helix domain-containing protein [Spirochaetota bacterium]
MKDNKAKLLKYLQKIEDWVSADELAIRLNLTSRTIRHYVSEINSSNQGGQALILSSRNGYRVNLRQGQPKDTTKKDANTKTPSQRFEQIVSILLNDECLTI